MVRWAPAASSGRSTSSSARPPGEDAIETLLDLHDRFGYAVIVVNGLAGLVALGAWRWPRLRGPWIWILVGAAQVALAAQVVLGVVLVAGDRYTTSNIHMFYGFVAFLTLALAYQYRDHFAATDETPRWRRLELFYGLVCLFLMGLAVRAVIEVAV